MSNYIILTKVMLRNFNLLSMKLDKPGKSRIKGVLFCLLILVAFMPMVFGIGSLSYGGYKVMSAIQQEGLILGMGFSAVSMAIFFFSIFYVMSVFYYSKDIESLLPLPLKPSEILGAKFTVTLLYEYLTELVFLAPVLIGFGAASKAGILYYLYGVLIFLTMPLLPLIYASILSMLVMRFTGLAKNRDRFRIIGGIIVMFLAIGINALATKLGNSNMSAAELQRVLEQGNNSFVGLISGIFFSNRFAVLALLYSNSIKGFVNLAVFVLICLLFVMLFLSLGEGLYFKGVVGISESTASRKKYSEVELKKQSGQQSALMAYIKKELKLLFRTPAYFMNCVLMNFLWPVFILVPFAAQPSEMKELQGLSEYVSNGNGSSVVLAAVFGISAFLTSTNAITASAISREGSNIYISKYLPLSYKSQIMAKVASGMIMGGIGCLSLLILGMVFIRPSILLAVSMIIVSFLGIAFSALVGILLDLNFPKLIWDNEQKAVKQNFNVVFNMLACVVVAGIPVFIAIALHFTLLTTFIVIAAVFGLLNLLLYNILSTVGVRLFKDIEV